MLERAGTSTADMGGHALVVGGSMAGLLAARVLSDHFERVTIIERDGFPEAPQHRKGVPQSRHLHVFMPRGREISERLFPGLEDEMLLSGAQFLDSSEDTEWLTPAGFAPRYRSGVRFLQSSRELLEWTVRGRVATLPQVHLLQRADVTGLVPAGNGDNVAGVRVRQRGGGEEKLHAGLVVDASGRNSRAPKWLAALGYEPPEETRVDARIGYATRIYRRYDGAASEWKAFYMQAAPPDFTRGGGLFPLEGGRWICTLSGTGGDYPPTDEEGFMAFARSMRAADLYDAIRDAEPLGGITGYRATENRRRHYESLTRQPHNFLAIGDAACAFNPVYGQGMTTAALGAEVLEESLRAHGGDVSGLSKRFQKKLAKANAGPWLLATGEDFRVRGVQGSKAGFSTRLTHRYLDRVIELSMRDLAVRQTFLEVFGMTKPPTVLFEPAIMSKVLRETLAGRKRTDEKNARGLSTPEAA